MHTCTHIHIVIKQALLQYLFYSKILFFPTQLASVSLTQFGVNLYANQSIIFNSCAMSIYRIVEMQKKLFQKEKKMHL